MTLYCPFSSFLHSICDDKTILYSAITFTLSFFSIHKRGMHSQCKRIQWGNEKQLCILPLRSTIRNQKWWRLLVAPPAFRHQDVYLSGQSQLHHILSHFIWSATLTNVSLHTEWIKVVCTIEECHLTLYLFSHCFFVWFTSTHRLRARVTLIIYTNT